MSALEVPYPQALARFPTLRQSLLSSFDNCGLSAYFDLEYRRGWSTKPQSRGQIFHQFAGECLRTMARPKEDTIPVGEALEILKEILRQDKVDRECPVMVDGLRCGTTEILPGVDEFGLRTCAKGHKFETELVNVPRDSVRELYWVAIKWAHENAFEIANLVDVEHQLRATVFYPHPHGGSVPRVLTGHLDALFVAGASAEHAIVLDWKDMWSLPAAHEGDADDDISSQGYFQQRFYALLIFKNYPSVQRVTLREFYVRYSQGRDATISRAQEEQIEWEMAELAERFDRAYEEQVWRPTAGKHCSFCTRPAKCPIPMYAREEGRIVDAQRAREVAEQIVVADEILKRARRDLRAWSETHGPVPLKDPKGPRALGYVDTVRHYSPKPDDIRKAEIEKGGPLTADEVIALWRHVPGTTFKPHVPKPAKDDSVGDQELQRQLLASIDHATAKHGLPNNVVALDPNKKKKSA